MRYDEAPTEKILPVIDPMPTLIPDMPTQPCQRVHVWGEQPIHRLWQPAWRPDRRLAVSARRW